MPRLEYASPVLASLDIGESVAFYRDQLGFSVSLEHEGDYGIVTRDGIEIHLWKCNDPEIPKTTSCRIRVEGIDDLHVELEPRGVLHPRGAIADKPYGLREFSVVDGDGNLIVFDAPIRRTDTTA